jgi:hypothetical protein
MAISDTQKVDYLWKKLGYGATKTDTNDNKKAPNEAIPSPLLLRGDKVWQQASSIPGTLPGSNAAPVTVHTTSLPFECSADLTSTANRTWKTSLTDWIPPELGSTYQAKVYIHYSSFAGNAAANGVQVFATGSGNNDEWFFDYQSGVLHFIGTNLPDGVNFAGKSVYISGGRYTGTFGVGSSSGSNANIGNLQINNTTISSVNSGANIIIASDGAGSVQFTGNAIGLPLGGTDDRPSTLNAGYIRFNTDTGTLEVYDGSAWDSGLATITSQILNGNGSDNVFTLSSSVSSVNELIISINGTLQQPTAAYSVAGTDLTFTEVPVTGDVIEVRHISGGVVSIDKLQLGTTSIAIPVADGSIEVAGAFATINANTTVLSSGVATTIDSFSKLVYRTAKYTIQATDDTRFAAYEVLVTHNGTAAVSNQITSITTAEQVGNVTTTISGNNVLIQFTADYANTNVRLSKNYIIK